MTDTDKDKTIAVLRAEVNNDLRRMPDSDSVAAVAEALPISHQHGVRCS